MSVSDICYYHYQGQCNFGDQCYWAHVDRDAINPEQQYRFKIGKTRESSVSQTQRQLREDLPEKYREYDERCFNYYTFRCIKAQKNGDVCIISYAIPSFSTKEELEKLVEGPVYDLLFETSQTELKQLKTTGMDVLKTF